MTCEDYAISGGEEGKQRLDLVAEVLRPTTTNLLRQAGIGPGACCLDAGCGGGNVTRDLAQLVCRATTRATTSGAQSPESSCDRQG